MADATAALSARSKVQAFLEAACSGDLEALRKFGSALDEEGKGAAAVAAGVRDANKRTALHFAAREGQTEVCKFLVEQLRLPVDPKDDDGETPLIHAARQGRLETVEYLLGRGADPSIASNMGATALHHAAGIGHIEIMKLLLGKGVDVESESESGTPLVWAAGHGQEDAVKLLLEHNAKPNTETVDGITSLLSAVAAGSLPCLEVLIQAGANPNVAAGGATPLHIAADSGNLEMIKCLLQAGGDPNTSDDDGFKPIQVAALRDNLEVVEHLLPLTSPIPDVEHLLVMAPTWPEFLVKHFVNGCVNVVEQGITIPAMADMFYMKLAEYMLSKAKVPVTKDDLTAQFQHFRRLWGCYQKDKQSVTLACSMESKNLKNKDAMMRNLKKEFDLNKYKDILKYEDQFNYIFPSCHIQNSTPVRAFMYNTGSSGDISVTSNRKRSIEEPFSRQLRQKSSDIDKPESSENGMTLDIALDELSVHDELSVLTYGIAAECLQDPIKLRAYSRLPTIEKKVQFLHVAWRLQYDPTSALAGLPPPS